MCCAILQIGRSPVQVLSKTNFSITWAPVGLKRWYGPGGSKLLLRHKILGGFLLDSQKVGPDSATRAMAAPMLNQDQIKLPVKSTGGGVKIY